MIEFLRKGNTYQLQWQLLDKNNAIVTDDKVNKVEFVFGKIVKYYPEDATFATDINAFVINFTQEETFSFADNRISCQARVKFIDNSVDATDIFNIYIKDSLTKVVL